MKVLNYEKPTQRRNVQFTDRQIEVVQAWSNYPTIAQAAGTLDISENTFQTHLRRMRQKVRVSRTIDLFLYLQRRGRL